MVRPRSGRKPAESPLRQGQTGPSGGRGGAIEVGPAVVGRGGLKLAGNAGRGANRSVGANGAGYDAIGDQRAVKQRAEATENAALQTTVSAGAATKRGRALSTATTCGARPSSRQRKYSTNRASLFTAPLPRPPRPPPT